MLLTARNYAKLTLAEREAMLERLAVTLERNALSAAAEGNDSLATVMGSVGAAILSVANDLAAGDVELAQDVIARALTLIATFHVLHPTCPRGPAMH